MSGDITSRRNPLITRVRRLGADRGFRRSEGAFLCEGVKLVGEAVKWGARVETVLVAEGARLPYELPAGAACHIVPEGLLKACSTLDTPQGVLAVCAMPDTAVPREIRPGRYLVLDGLQDPGNVGTIWRTADAFGADALFLVNHCADPFSPKTVRSTMGACFRLNVWEGELEGLARALGAAQIPLYATALREDTADVRQLPLRSAAVIIGSEGRGVSAQALELCEQTVKIPMTGRCESLNAAVAASIVLWEMYKGN